jgi:glycosyltransferase involved in cell wall biosynthesis
MAVGLFPVVTDIEGNRYWVDDRKGGLTFSPGEPGALADAIFEASLMRPKFEQIAHANRQRIEAEAIWQNNMTRVKNAFFTLAAQWPKKS